MALLGCLLALLVLPGDPRADLVEARHRFEQGDYAATVTLLRPIVDRDIFSEAAAAERSEALRLYGVASFLLGRRGDAEGSFLALLSHEPQIRLAPQLYPPDVVAFFEEVRARREAELAAVERRVRPKKSLVLALLPFGIGQLQNHQRLKGFLLMGSEVALFAAGTTTYLLLTSEEGQGHTFADPDRARALREANLGCWIAFGAVAAYGLIDALVYYRKGREPDLAGPRAVLAPLPGGGWVAQARWGF